MTCHTQLLFKLPSIPLASAQAGLVCGIAESGLVSSFFEQLYQKLSGKLMGTSFTQERCKFPLFCPEGKEE